LLDVKIFLGYNFSDMKILALAVLLSIAQAPAPIPRQATDNAARGGHHVKQQSNAKQTPSANALPAQNTTSPGDDKHKGETPSKADAPETIFISESTSVPVKDWWDKAYAVFTGLLFLVGGIGVGYAVKTLRVIERQAKANEDTLAEIKAAGVQTASLITQAKKHADAAKKSADALVNAERAWIMADMVFSGEVIRGLPDSAPYIAVHETSIGGIGTVEVDICLICKNDGRTPAWITERRICFRNVAVLPTKPDYETVRGWEYMTQELAPMKVGGDLTTRWKLECEGPTKAGNDLFAYGIVKYRDAFSPERETRFIYTVQGREFRRLVSTEDYWEYCKYT
jgi:hypothetical protein